MGKQLFDRQLKELKKFVTMRSYIPFEVGDPASLTGDYHKAFLEGLGFKIVSVMEAFYKVEFPLRWKLFIPHGMNRWCYLLDKKGRKRGAIYYLFLSQKNEETGKIEKKVATHINYIPRYRVIVDQEVKLNFMMTNSEEHFNSPIVARIIDGDGEVVLAESQKVKIHIPYTDDTKEEFIKEERIQKDFLYNEMIAKLKVMYPEFESIIAYWDK